MTHSTTIITKPPGGGFAATDKTIVQVTVHLSDDPLKAARQTMKIERLMDKIIKIGDAAE